MEYVSANQINNIIRAARSGDDAQTLQTLGRGILHTKAAMYAHALKVYKKNPELRGDAWRLWVKNALKSVLSYKDISMLVHGTVVLARLDEVGVITSHGGDLDAWDFIHSRLSYLQDSLAILKKCDYTSQGEQLFKETIRAAAEMSRSDLRAYLDMLNFGCSERAACRRQQQGRMVTFTIVCSEQQALKLQPRLEHLVAMQ